MVKKQISIQCNVSKSDFQSLRIYYMYRRKPKRTRILVYLCLASIASLATSEAISGMQYLRLAGIAGMIVVAGIYCWITFDTRHLDETVKQFLNARQDVTLTTDGVAVNWKGFEPTEYTWNEIDHTVETDSHFYLFIDPEFAVMLPKLEMKEFQIREIHELLSSHAKLIQDMSGWKADKI